MGGRARGRLEVICLVGPGRPSRALLMGEQFEVWPGYDPLDVRGDVVRFAAMLSSRRDNELRNVACDPFRFAAGREQALLSVLPRPIAESGAVGRAACRGGVCQ